VAGRTPGLSPATLSFRFELPIHAKGRLLGSRALHWPLDQALVARGRSLHLNSLAATIGDVRQALIQPGRLLVPDCEAAPSLPGACLADGQRRVHAVSSVVRQQALAPQEGKQVMTDSLQ
jgi:hypothetical protein